MQHTESKLAQTEKEPNSSHRIIRCKLCLPVLNNNLRREQHKYAQDNGYPAGPPICVCHVGLLDVFLFQKVI